MWRGILMLESPRKILSAIIHPSPATFPDANFSVSTEHSVVLSVFLYANSSECLLGVRSHEYGEKVNFPGPQTLAMSTSYRPTGAPGGFAGKGGLQTGSPAAFFPIGKKIFVESPQGR